MKKIIVLLYMATIAIGMYAQNDVTTFLGIPVDGYKSEMRQKLLGKGFTPKNVGNNEYFEGEFNGTDVHVYIATNNNKVYRIMLCDANTQNEANIKVRFNKLVSQFEKNQRYIYFGNYTLDDDVDISYDMAVKNKNFDALFYQVPNMENVDKAAYEAQIIQELQKKYTKEQIESPTEEVNEEAKRIAISIGMDLAYKKPVWFRICEQYGEYYITMYYDNEYNHANGEDL